MWRVIDGSGVTLVIGADRFSTGGTGIARLPRISPASALSQTALVTPRARRYLRWKSRIPGDPRLIPSRERKHMGSGGRKPLGQSLVEQGHLSADGLARALEEQRRTGQALREVLLRLELVQEQAILDYYEEQLGIPRMDLTTYVLEPEIVRLVPERIERQYKLVPLVQC